MKKLFCGLFACAFALVLSGCGSSNKLVCTMEENGSKSEATIFYDGDKVEKAEIKMTFSTEEEAQLTYAFASLDEGTNAKIDGKTVSMTISADEITEDSEDTSKEAMKKELEAEGYTCK